MIYSPPLNIFFGRCSCCLLLVTSALCSSTAVQLGWINECLRGQASLLSCRPPARCPVLLPVLWLWSGFKPLLSVGPGLSGPSVGGFKPLSCPCPLGLGKSVFIELRLVKLFSVTDILQRNRSLLRSSCTADLHQSARLGRPTYSLQFHFPYLKHSLKISGFNNPPSSRPCL